MNLSQLPKLQTKGKRRLGQGHGSGRVKTGGRGTKGQKARSHIKLSFEGGAIPLIKRLPFLRGQGRNKAQNKAAVVNVGQLNILPAKSVVTAKLLVEKGIVGKKQAKYGVKILGNGKLDVSLTVAVMVSGRAQKVIEKAGGSLQEAPKVKAQQ